MQRGPALLGKGHAGVRDEVIPAVSILTEPTLRVYGLVLKYEVLCFSLCDRREASLMCSLITRWRRRMSEESGRRRWSGLRSRQEEVLSGLACCVVSGKEAGGRAKKLKGCHADRSRATGREGW